MGSGRITASCTCTVQPVSTSMKQSRCWLGMCPPALSFCHEEPSMCARKLTLWQKPSIPSGAQHSLLIPWLQGRLAADIYQAIGIQLQKLERLRRFSFWFLTTRAN